MPNALSRKKDYRNNVVRNLATSLILYEEIKTTKAKAKALKPALEHLIVIAKKNDLRARRILEGYLFDKNAVKKMLEVLVPRFQKTNSGFIKTYKLGSRLGDNAEMVLMQLVEGEVATPVTEKVPPKKVVKSKENNAIKVEKPAKDASKASKASAKKTK